MNTNSDVLPVTLRPIDRQNWQECSELSVREDQRELICTNDHSLAEAGILPEAEALAICNGPKMAGLLVIIHDSEEDEIHRLMIDQRYQSKD